MWYMCTCICVLLHFLIRTRSESQKSVIKCDTRKTLLLLDGLMDLNQTWTQCSPSGGGHLGCAQFLDPDQDPDLTTKNVWYTKNATPPRRLDGYEPNLGTIFPWWGGIWVVVSFWIQIRIRILCLSQNLTFITLFNCWSNFNQTWQICGTCVHAYVCYSIFLSGPDLRTKKVW